MLTLAILFASTLAVAGQDRMTNSGSWSAVIINIGCTVDEAFAEANLQLFTHIGEWGFWAGKGFRAESIPLGEKVPV
jgi:hypothetical protein